MIADKNKYNTIEGPGFAAFIDLYDSTYAWDQNSDTSVEMLGELYELVETFNLTNIFILDSSKKPVSQSIKDLNEGIRLWKLFVMLALSFLIIEGIILRFWK